MPVSVFRGKGISDGVKTERNQLEKLFLEGNPPDGLGHHVKRDTRRSREWRVRPPPWAHPLPRGAPVAPPTFSFHPYIPTYPKTSRTENRSVVPPPQASVATKNQSGPHSGTLPEGDPITGGHLHHPGAIQDEEGVVHPQGWGYVPVAMCLISLSHVLSHVPSMARSWCISSFAIVVGYYDVSPPLLSCDELSFPFWSYLIGLSLLWTLDVCLAWDNRGDNGLFYWSTWCMFWWSTCGFRDTWEPMHRGWHTFLTLR